MNTRSAEVLLELEAILQANASINFVDISGPVEPLASETNSVASYISCTNVVPKLYTSGPELDSYDMHGFFVITTNVDCSLDKLKVYDIADSIQRSILNDSTIWSHLVDRDIIAVEYDNAQFYPKRSVVIALEVTYRLLCA